MTLRVRASGSAMVPDLSALAAGVRRFIGRTFDASVGPNGGYPSSSEVAEIPEFAEYKKAVQDGDLAPADAETAAKCGVKFAEPAAAKK